MRPLADYHTHTRWSHASGSVAHNLRAAEALGLKAVGIAEHGPNLLFVGVPTRRWPALHRAVTSSKEAGTKLLFNIEANVVSLDGDLDIPGYTEDKLDMLLVGLHPRVVPAGLSACWAFYGMRWLALLSRRQRHQLYDTFTAALVNCVNKHKVDIVVHPGYGLPIDSRELAAACARTGTFLEINCKHTEVIGKDIKIAAKIPEVQFVIGSDAHRPQDVGRFEPGFRLVRELGLDRERVVNVDWQENAR